MRGIMPKRSAIDVAAYSNTEALEDAIVSALADRVHTEFKHPTKREQTVRDQLRTLSDEERLQIVHQTIEGYHSMPTDQQRTTKPARPAGLTLYDRTIMRIAS
jgi:hypothetical protein